MAPSATVSHSSPIGLEDGERLDFAKSVSSIRYPELDGIRGIACLTVLIWHIVGASLTSDYGAVVKHDNPVFKALMPAFFVFGTGGVDFFFVLSGFLISGILIDHRATAHYFSTFYLRRICRILPVYFLVYGALLLCVITGFANIPAYRLWLFNHLMPLWTYPFFLQNIFMSRVPDGHGNFISMTWSVAVEEQFYLFFPLVVMLIPVKRLPVFCLSAIAISVVSRAILPALGWWTYPLLICRFDALAVGVLCACAVRNQKALNFFYRSKVFLYCLIAVAFVSLLLTVYRFQLQDYQHFLISAILYGACLMLVFCHRETIAARICRWSWLRYLGLISYGAYMYHQAVNGFLHAALRAQPPTVQDPFDCLIIALSFACTFALSALSYHFIESRFLALGKKAKWS